MSPFVVHTVPGSPFARSVMAVLEEKGATWRLAALAPMMSKQEPHISRHPFGRMPVLEHGDFWLYESQAIVRYIDRALPQPALTPADAQAAARMDQLLNLNDWYLFQGWAAVVVFQRIVGPRLLGMTTDEAAVAEAALRGPTVVRELTRLLGDAPYFTGATPSLADFAIAAQLDLMAETPEWTPLAASADALVDWLERMRARPSMQATTWPKLEAMAA
jgi:glutathione S-transferase